MTVQPHLSGLIEQLYKLFEAYPRPKKVKFCTFCYDEDQIRYLRTTPLRELDPEITRLLIWEASDHFESTDVYKHYLPRMLEFLAPPIRCEDIYPEHLFETLRAHGFRDWPATEREVFWSYVVAVNQALEDIDRRAAWEWRIASGKLAGGPYPNEGLLSGDRLE